MVIFFITKYFLFFDVSLDPESSMQQWMHQIPNSGVVGRILSMFISIPCTSSVQSLSVGWISSNQFKSICYCSKQLHQRPATSFHQIRNHKILLLSILISFYFTLNYHSQYFVTASILNMSLILDLSHFDYIHQITIISYPFPYFNVVSFPFMIFLTFS